SSTLRSFSSCHLHSLRSLFFFLTLPPPPRSTLFPYTTLFRSSLHLSNFARAFESPALNSRCRSFLERRRVLRRISLRAKKSGARSEEHTSELQSLTNLVCRLLLEKKKNNKNSNISIIMKRSNS